MTVLENRCTPPKVLKRLAKAETRIGVRIDPQNSHNPCPFKEYGDPGEGWCSLGSYSRECAAAHIDPQPPAPKDCPLRQGRVIVEAEDED